MRLARWLRRPVPPALLLAGLLCACAGPSPPEAAACDRSEGPPSLGRGEWAEPEEARTALATQGFSRIRLRVDGDRHLWLHVYRPTTFEPLEGGIWFVMHGVRRNAGHYARVAVAAAERHGVLVVAPEYGREDYRATRTYTFGVAAESAGPTAASSPLQGSHADLERAFDAIRDALGGRQSGYHLFGHSAGGQFVHRLLTFLPCARVESAVAANAGWYTLPIPGDAGGHGDSGRLEFPYGLRGAPEDSVDLDELLRFPLILLLGTEDTRPAAEDRNLRSSPGAMAQGAHRLARGQYYFDQGRSTAQHRGVDFGWRLHFAPGAGHNVREVIDSAANLQFTQSDAGAESLCDAATPASESRAGLRVQGFDDSTPTEEGRWHIRVSNTGSAPLCLSGWRLRDYDGRVLHLFPVDAPLPPGGHLFVYGPRVAASDATRGQRAAVRGGESIDPDAGGVVLEAADGTPVDSACWRGRADPSCVPAHSSVN